MEYRPVVRLILRTKCRILPLYSKLHSQHSRWCRHESRTLLREGLSLKAAVGGFFLTNAEDSTPIEVGSSLTPGILSRVAGVDMSPGLFGVLILKAFLSDGLGDGTPNEGEFPSPQAGTARRRGISLGSCSRISSCRRSSVPF